MGKQGGGELHDRKSEREWFGKLTSTRDCSPSEAELIQTCSSQEKRKKKGHQDEKNAHNTVESPILLIHVTATVNVNCQVEVIVGLSVFARSLNGPLEGRSRMFPSSVFALTGEFVFFFSNGWFSRLP